MTEVRTFFYDSETSTLTLERQVEKMEELNDLKYVGRRILRTATKLEALVYFVSTKKG